MYQNNQSFILKRVAFCIEVAEKGGHSSKKVGFYAKYN